MDAETRYANIERELLAIVFACQRFSIYLLGRRHVPCLAQRHRCWDFRDELSTDDGILLKGLRLIIPGELQEEYLSHLHEGHLSTNKVQENAKLHMYWTGITPSDANNVSKSLR